MLFIVNVKTDILEILELGTNWELGTNLWKLDKLSYFLTVNSMLNYSAI